MSTNQPRGPGYREIAEHYRQRILSGELAAGTRLPTVREIQETWQVSNTTAAAAMAELRNEHLTIARPRVGTVVAPLPETVVTGLARIDQLTRTGTPFAKGETTFGHISALRSCYDPYVADQLGIELGDEIVLRIRVFAKDGKPTAVGVSCIHTRALTVVPELIQGAELPKFWQLMYAERTGDEISATDELFWARPASDDELNALGVMDAPAHSAVPVLVSNTTFYTPDGLPIEVWEDTYAPGTRKAVPRARG